MLPLRARGHSDFQKSQHISSLYDTPNIFYSPFILKPVLNLENKSALFKRTAYTVILRDRAEIFSKLSLFLRGYAYHRQAKPSVASGNYTPHLQCCTTSFRRTGQRLTIFILPQACSYSYDMYDLAKHFTFGHTFFYCTTYLPERQL